MRDPFPIRIVIFHSVVDTLTYLAATYSYLTLLETSGLILTKNRFDIILFNHLSHTKSCTKT